MYFTLSRSSSTMWQSSEDMFNFVKFMYSESFLNASSATHVTFANAASFPTFAKYNSAVNAFPPSAQTLWLNVVVVVLVTVVLVTVVVGALHALSA